MVECQGSDLRRDRSCVSPPTTSEHGWHPVARSDDLAPRHVFQGQLMGRELALWRADDGFVNVWENRCLHRGVRLTLGRNEGRELVCRYHAWRYANRTAGCTYIPAHPADAPAQTVCNLMFPAVERYGLIWSGDDPVGAPPQVEVLEAGATLGLRNLSVNVEPEVALSALASHTFSPSASVIGGVGHSPAVEVTGEGPGWLQLTSRAATDTSTAVFFVQPVDSNRCVIRCILADHQPDVSSEAILHHHNRALIGFRDGLELAAAERNLPEPLTPQLQRVPLRLSVVPEPTSDGRTAPLRTTVSRRWDTAEGIVAFELRAIEGQLPTAQPGAHIDVHLPNSLIRQYSLVNGPGETDRYLIGVKLEPNSRGGSSSLHNDVREGDVLAISEPRNNFSLRRDCFETILVAGGIGITPLLAMAQALHHDRLTFRLHYFVQGATHQAFAEVLASLGDALTIHSGLGPAETGSELQRLLANPVDGHDVYVCGPGPMLDAARTTAATAGWPEAVIHFEYFKNANELDRTSTFEVELARSALTLPVPVGQSIIEVLRANGVSVPTSCEQGACGTCVTPLLDGDADHQDVYLTQSERDAGNRIAICVSRATSGRLVLDL